MPSQQSPSSGQSGQHSQPSSVPAEHAWVAAALGIPELAPQWWSEVQPTARTAEFRSAVEAMRRKAADALRAAFAVPDHLPFLLRKGLSGETPRIKRLVIAFDRSAAAALLLSSGMARSAAGGAGHPHVRLSPATADEADPLALQLATAPPDGLPEALADVSGVLGVPADATVFGALARWPEYAEYAWSKAKALAASPAYAPLLERLVAAADALAAQLPWPAAASVDAAALAHIQRHAAANVAMLAAMRLGLAIPDGWRPDAEPAPPLRVNPAGDHTARRAAQTG